MDLTPFDINLADPEPVQINIQFENGDLLLSDAATRRLSNTSISGRITGPSVALPANLISDRQVNLPDYGFFFDVASRGFESGDNIALGVGGNERWTNSDLRLSEIVLENNFDTGFMTSLPTLTFDSFTLFGRADSVSVVDELLLPISTDPGNRFVIPIGGGCGQRFCSYDPDYATGYEYSLSSDTAPNFEAVRIPGALPGGDSVFEISFDGSTFALNAGEIFDFTDYVAGGVAEFAINGIDVDEMLPPDDPTAFVTDIRFVSGFDEDVNLFMTPVITSVDPSRVPEPGTLLLAAAALASFGYSRRKAS